MARRNKRNELPPSPTAVDLAATPTVPDTALIPPEQDRDPNLGADLTPRSLISQTRTFFDTIGREGVAHMLEVLGGDDPKSEESRLLSLLRDPDWVDTPLHLLARRAGIPLSKLKEHFVSYQITEGTLRAYQHVPKMMEDTAIAATERPGECPSCINGFLITDGASEPCKSCKGTGLVTLYPDPAARSIMFETTGLTKKGGGIVIQQNNNTFSSPTSFEDLMRESSKLIDVTPRDKE